MADAPQVEAPETGGAELSGDDALLMRMIQEADADLPADPLATAFTPEGEYLGTEDGAEDATPDAEGDAEEMPEEQADEASAEGEGEDEAAADVQGLDEALKAALRRDGLSDDLIDLLVSKGRDSALEYALRRQENQREVSLAYQERAQLKKQAEAQTGNGEEVTTVAQPEPVNLDELAQPLREELGEETAGAVVKLAQALVQPMQAELQALRDAQATTAQERIQEAVSATRRSLRERFPQLADDATWNKVIERGKRIEGGYGDVGGSIHDRLGAILTDAAGLVLGNGSASADATRRRTSGAPTSPRRKPSPKSMTPEEREYQAFLEIEAKHSG